MSHPSNVLGGCVSCEQPALAYSGATRAGDGKYRCARCTARSKLVERAPKAPVHRGRAVRRDHAEPPAVAAARWLPLGGNRFALVDAGDFQRASVKSWFLFGGHAVRREQWGGKLRHGYLHRFVLGLDDAAQRAQTIIEFIDGDPLNCRRANLRVTSRPA